MIVKSFNLFAVALILAVTGCSLLPFQTSSNVPAGNDNLTPHTRRVETTAYTGDHGAIIFSLCQVEDIKLAGAIDSIIRVFAENSVPVM